MQNACFQTTHSQIQTIKSLNNLWTRMNKTPILLQDAVQTPLKMCPEIQSQTIQIGLWTTRCLFFCSLASPGCPQVAKMVPRVPKWRHLACQMTIWRAQDDCVHFANQSLLSRVTWKQTSRNHGANTRKSISKKWNQTLKIQRAKKQGTGGMGEALRYNEL